MFLSVKGLSDAPFTFNDYLSRHYIYLESNQEKCVNDKQQEDIPIKDEFVKIDVRKFMVAYLTEYLRDLYEKGLKKFPKEPIITLCYASFALNTMHNPFLCMNLLRTFNQASLPNLERLNYKANEAYLIH